MSTETQDVWLPPYATVPLLSPAECEKILLRVPELDMQPAMRVGEDGPDHLVVDEDYRRALTCKSVPGDPIYELVLKRVLEKLPEINAPFGFDLFAEPYEMLPAIMLNRYDAGEKPGHHGWHVDTGNHPFAQHRKLSIVTTLSHRDSYAGGDLQLHDGGIHLPLESAPEGTGVVFHGLTLHRVTPMFHGTRYSCVIWLMGPRFR